MLAAHCSSAVPVLHVPQSMLFRSVKFPCADMKSSELWSNSEKGRHDLNGCAFVMFVKKLRHDRLEKFWAIMPSYGCGNGVGRGGGDDGTVGTATPLAEGTGFDEEPDARADVAVCVGDAETWRLWCCSGRRRSGALSGDETPTRFPRRKDVGKELSLNDECSWVRIRAVAVIATRISGTRMIA